MDTTLLMDMLLKIVVAWVALSACHSSRTCRVAASIDDEGEERLCHGPSKYLRITYKCKPEAFKTRITCEGRDMHLVCRKHQRLAFYSALYGTSRKGTIECPSNSTASADNECVAQCALDEVVRLCQGQRKCNVPVSKEIFGDPCPPHTQKYLKVMYSCVSKRILKKISEDKEYPHLFCGKEKNETLIAAATDAAAALPVQPSTIIVPTASPRPVGNTTCLPPEHPDIAALEDRYIGFLADWFNMWQYAKENEEKIILYFVIGLLTAVILLLLVIIFKLHRKRRRSKGGTSSTSTPSPLPTNTPTMAQPPSRGGGAALPLLERSPDSYEPVELLSFQNQSTFTRNNNSRVTSPIETARGQNRSTNNRSVSVVVSNDSDRDEPDTSMPRPLPPDPSTFSLDEERMTFNSATLGSRSFDNYYR